MKSRWREAIYANQVILADFPNDVEAYNRLGKALTEEGRLHEARDAFACVLSLSPHNPIARKNLERLMQIGDSRTAPSAAAGLARRAFMEESGKSGIAPLINLAPALDMLKEAPGRLVTLKTEGGALKAYSAGDKYLGQVEPRLGSRLINLMRRGNRYEAAVISVGESHLEVIIRETFRHRSMNGAVPFPSKGNGEHGVDLVDSTPGYEAGEEEVEQGETIPIKDWSNDDTEPGDDEAFTPDRVQDHQSWVRPGRPLAAAVPLRKRTRAVVETPPLQKG